MNSEKGNTKDNISEVALNLFSQKGYSSVSIRDICSKVGIKESSIYYHFKNKKEIFDGLCKYFSDYTENVSKNITARMSDTAAFTDDQFISICKGYLNDYLMNEKINKFIRMLIIEQSTNAKAAEIYHLVLFDKALEGQKTIFEWLIRIGYLRDLNADSLVMEYYAPFVYIFHRYLIAEEITEKLREEVNRKVLKHVRHFISEYKSVD